MPKGGPQPGSGRPRGIHTPHKTTLEKIAAREAVRQAITRELQPLIDAHIRHAIGISHMMLRQEDGTWKRATSGKQITEALNSGNRNAYYIYTKDPSVQSFSELLDRALDRPKDQAQEIILTADQALIDALNMGRKRARELRAGTPEPPVIDVTPDPPGSDTVQ